MPVTDQDTIDQLNTILRNKLTAINQYFLHARVLKHMGHVQLADQEYKASIDAMKHSDMLVEHILQLGGLPNMQDLGKLLIGDVPEIMLHNDLKHVQASVVIVKKAIAACEHKGTATRVILTKLLENHQERMDLIHAQLAEFAPTQRSCA